MKMLSAIALALAAATPALAQNTVTLDFEAAPGFVNSIGGFYNGGTDSLGQVGPNYGVSFTDAAVGLSNDALGPYYSNAPTPLTVLFALDATAVLNAAQGFVNFLAFEYSSSSPVANAVNIYSGLNATGTLLGRASLLGNAQVGCTGTAFCNFDPLRVEFPGLARSISFGGGAPNVLYDNITITAVPEPSTYLMMVAGLAAVLRLRNRRQAA